MRLNRGLSALSEEAVKVLLVANVSFLSIIAYCKYVNFCIGKNNRLIELCI